LPQDLRASLQLPQGFFSASDPQAAALRLLPGGGRQFSQWVYALAAPFPTVQDGVSSEQLRRSWSGDPAGAFAGRPLLVDESTLGVFTILWGPPAPGAVASLPAGDLQSYAWEQRPAWAMLPFEALGPRWKVLEVDGLSPLRKDFDPGAYALTVPIGLEGEEKLVELTTVLYGPGSATPLVPPTNRDPAKLTVVAMTGVTALVRATAFTMEQRGVRYPAKDVGEWLRSADITHISNEVPFAKKCPYPDPVQQGMRFCSDTRYIELMEEVGTDIVELTGDHFQDWGEEAMFYTLELYRERGWPYYGGGEDTQDARKPAIIEHNGNRLAFIGCNGKGGGYAQAGPNHPGAVFCDFDYLEGEISRLAAEGYLVVATFQHFEYYTYRAQPDQERDFRRLAGAGAVVVSGSQAHQPQAFEFDEGALIHYGLGNMFFDQLDVSPATRQAFVDRHIFYNGRYLGAELLAMMFVDYARPRPMTSEEREELLRAVFNASGW
jgi:poly-gamma-glutamate synthesis protein (capsule biosynthesis protein)